ncbi:MAG: GIY-YIG nuclease family protein [Chloroflexi bacterium]|nr:GIY-YIG nuclease family protein [Chloroflexota bacterium]
MKTIGQFEEMIANLPVVLKALQLSPALNVEGLDKVPDSGIYVFYENQRPVYVGRSNSLKSRLRSHGRESSDHRSATFAFILAVKEAKNRGIDTSPTRDQLQDIPVFREIYSDSKKRVRKMEIRVVEIVDAIEQTVFEVYASLALETPHNSFENH